VICLIFHCFDRTNKQNKINFKRACLAVVCREELQEAQYQAAKANLVPCRNCSRRFAPDRVGVHERICKGPKKPPPGGASPEYEDADIPPDKSTGRRAAPVASQVY